MSHYIAYAMPVRVTFDRNVYAKTKIKDWNRHNNDTNEMSKKHGGDREGNNDNENIAKKNSWVTTQAGKNSALDEWLKKAARWVTLSDTWRTAQWWIIAITSSEFAHQQMGNGVNEQFYVTPEYVSAYVCECVLRSSRNS